jgi:hypothetical protein
MAALLPQLDRPPSTVIWLQSHLPSLMQNCRDLIENISEYHIRGDSIEQRAVLFRDDAASELRP